MTFELNEENAKAVFEKARQDLTLDDLTIDNLAIAARATDALRYKVVDALTSVLAKAIYGEKSDDYVDAITDVGDAVVTAMTTSSKEEEEKVRNLFQKGHDEEQEKENG